MKAGGEDEFWHKLALALGGRTIAEWQAVMSHSEFQCWMEFARHNPFDDLHRYHRPASLLAASKGYPQQAALDWLHPPRLPDDIDSIGLSVMRALGAGPEA